MAKRYTREELNKVITEYLGLLKGKIRVDKAILFGSYAKGLEQDYSDIDLLVISEDLPENKLMASNGFYLDNLAGKFEPSLEVIGAHPNNLNDPVSQQFYKEVLTTGIEVN